MSSAPELEFAAQIAVELGLVSKSKADKIEHRVDDAVYLASDFAILINSDTELKSLFRKKCIEKKIKEIKNAFGFKCLGKHFTKKDLIVENLTDYTLIEDVVSNKLVHYYLKSNISEDISLIYVAAKAGNKYYINEGDFYCLDRNAANFMYNLIA